MNPRGFCPAGPLWASISPVKCGEKLHEPTTASSTAGAVVNVRVWAHANPPGRGPSAPQRRKEYGVPAASRVAFWEIGPLAPAGHCRLCVWKRSLAPVCQYSNQLVAGPLFAVPCAFSRADSGPMSVAGSVEP
jgi:hypothetical protein